VSRVKSFGVSLIRNWRNVNGLNLNRKIIVIESDDWGSIRVPSKEVYQKFVQKGFGVEHSQYNRYDALESNDDLTSLFEILRKHKNRLGQAPCITANTIIANPDFERIEKSRFQDYYYEHFTETLRRYPQHNGVLELYREGMKQGLFKPQFHGREHVQANRWLKALRAADEDMIYAFRCATTYSGKGDYSFMESFDWDFASEVENQQEIIRDGLQLFTKTFGYKSTSFIAPCYTWDPRLEPVLAKEGVQYMQGGRNQYIPMGGFENYKTKRHKLGEKLNGLTYLVRNCFFEPSLVSKPDWVDYTLASVRDAFRWNKPAIICAHRINFVGYIDENNRTKNLKQLDELFRRILIRWPEVEFMSSDQLGDLISRCQK
jgi:hypothetical protein